MTKSFTHVWKHRSVHHGWKFFSRRIIKTFLFETLFFHKNFKQVSFFSYVIVKILQSEISCRNPVKCDVLDTAGVWPTYLFVAGSIILLQCLSMIHKTGPNHRNDGIWRLLLLEHIPTFGELDDKETGPNHWKWNNFTWNLLQKSAVWNKALGYHSHLVQHGFCPILEQSNPSKKSITQHGLRQNVH